MSATTAQVAQTDPGGGLRRRFSEVRSLTLRLTESLSPEDQMLQSMPDASPTKWHLAHTTWFFETFLLLPNQPSYKAFDSRFQFLFNSYYKQVGAHPLRGSRGIMSRPPLSTIHDYRRQVDAAVTERLARASDEELSLVELGLNHEQQHQELILTDIKHALWSSPLPLEEHGGTNDASPAQTLKWLRFDGGIRAIGHAGGGFAFDNETPRHEFLLRPFQIACRCVTNAEYLEFMDNGGYRRPELWLSDGWDRVCADHWESPLYWERGGDGVWRTFGRTGMKPVEPAEPVCHVSYFEADAFARWSGARLPTEEEWEIAAGCDPARGALMDSESFHPQPSSGVGLTQMIGDVWEWTASPYGAYPAFRPAKGPLGEYNGKFMCNQFVLRGGSCCTPASHIRPTYRNFFPPHARWQFSGIRLANDAT
jgi:ergothioneine biosynthesis protein EgtB